MSTLPLGQPVSYCSHCGSKVRVEVPSGDNKARYICASCSTVLYENPKLVVGCVTEYNDQILLCKRAIEPRLGYWTVPAGFMELGETLAEAASRETLEEACAKIEIGSLLAVVDVVHAGQVHVFFRGSLPDGNYATGDESLDAQLYSPKDIPWEELAFPSGKIALRQFLAQKEAGIEQVHTESAARIKP